jgi:hypothetical protein
MRCYPAAALPLSLLLSVTGALRAQTLQSSRRLSLCVGFLFGGKGSVVHGNMAPSEMHFGASNHALPFWQIFYLSSRRLPFGQVSSFPRDFS